jgi:hypothetical protein
LYRGAEIGVSEAKPRSCNRAATRSRKVERFSTGTLPAAVMTVIV